jgi:hypothetical protein
MLAMENLILVILVILVFENLVLVILVILVTGNLILVIRAGENLTMVILVILVMEKLLLVILVMENLILVIPAMESLLLVILGAKMNLTITMVALGIVKMALTMMMTDLVTMNRREANPGETSLEIRDIGDIDQNMMDVVRVLILLQRVQQANQGKQE